MWQLDELRRREKHTLELLAICTSTHNVLVLIKGCTNCGRKQVAPPGAGPLNQYGFTSIPAWISNYNHCNMWNEITYPIPNFHVAAAEIVNGRVIPFHSLDM